MTTGAMGTGAMGTGPGAPPSDAHAGEDAGPDAGEIRLAQGIDAPALVRLSQGLREALEEDPRHVTEAAVTRDLLGPDPVVSTAVAVDETGAVVGYASWHDAYEPAYAARGYYVVDLFVVTPARRQGWARRLLAFMAAHGRRRGISYLWLTANSGNADALKTYSKLANIHETVEAYAMALETFEALAAEGEAATEPDGAARG